MKIAPFHRRDRKKTKKKEGTKMEGRLAPYPQQLEKKKSIVLFPYKLVNPEGDIRRGTEKKKEDARGEGTIVRPFAG